MKKYKKQKSALKGYPYSAKKGSKNMNPAFYIIVIIICVAVWFLASSLYKPIGRFIGTIGKDAMDTMKDEEENESEEKAK